MKIVVFGPRRRTGALVGDQVIDLNNACAKYLHEKKSEARAQAMADVLAPADLAGFIEGGARALDSVHEVLDYVATAGGQHGLNGAPLSHPVANVKLHGPKPSPASRIACAGGNYAQHTAGITAGMTGEQ